MKEISDLLNTGLDDETLRICVQLLEAGVNPEALANVVQELRREAAAIQVCWSFDKIEVSSTFESTGRFSSLYFMLSAQHLV